jgi:hypothetical protein
MEQRIARHAEVISAIGVALGILQDTVERTLLNPSESDLVALRREAFERVQRMGADAATIEVFVEVDQREKRVRATARGSPQLRTRELGGELPTIDELRDAAAKNLRIDPSAVRVLDSDGWMHAFTGERNVRILLGLLPAIRTPVCVLDGEGIVRFSTDDAHAEQVHAEEVDATLAALVDRYSIWGDGGLELPEVQMVKPSQLVDLSGLVQPDQLLGLARAEVGGLAPKDKVTLIVRRRV